MAVNNGKIQVIADLEPVNNQDFPIVQDHYVLMSDGSRLDDHLGHVTEDTSAIISAAKIHIIEDLSAKIEDSSSQMSTSLNGVASALSKLAADVAAMSEQTQIEYPDLDEEEY